MYRCQLQSNTLELEYNTNLISMQVTKQKVGWAVYPSAKNDAFVSMFHKKLKQHKHITQSKSCCFFFFSSSLKVNPEY